MSKKFSRNENNLLLSIIGDEETVTGFLLAGIGERTEQSRNFFIIGANTEKIEIEEIFRSLISRRDVGIILISQHIAELIRETLDQYEEIIPTVLEIPSKNHPYSIEKDSIMQKAIRQLYGGNLPEDNK
jgi:V-type H+-transporting ATPase subunit F